MGEKIANFLRMRIITAAFMFRFSSASMLSVYRAPLTLCVANKLFTLLAMEIGPTSKLCECFGQHRHPAHPAINSARTHA